MGETGGSKRAPHLLMPAWSTHRIDLSEIKTTSRSPEELMSSLSSNTQYHEQVLLWILS